MKTAPNAWPRGEIDFSSSPDCEQRKLVVRLSYDEFDAFRERYADARETIHPLYNDDVGGAARLGRFIGGRRSGQ